MEVADTALGPDETAPFESFYRSELEPQVRRAYLLTGSNEVANDVVHDAMIEVYRRWSSLERPAAYLTVAVMNRCRDRARRGRVADRAAPMIAAPDAVPDDADQHRAAIDRALGGLPFNHRAAIVLRFYGGLTADEIASALGCPSGSVGPWINRGLAALRKELS